jgi:sugar phosphate isomerase/epimerase
VRIGEGFDARACRPLLDAGQALGARAVLVAGDDPDAARLTESYARLCETMRPYGLGANLEFMPWTAVPDARTALRVVEAAGTPANAGILVDALHFDRSATTLDDIRALPRQLLHYAQICDAPNRARLGRDFTTEELIHTARRARLPPGEGDIDLAGLFAALPADLPVSVEVIHLERMKSMDPAEWAGQCLAASRPFVSQFSRSRLTQIGFLHDVSPMGTTLEHPCLRKSRRY